MGSLRHHSQVTATSIIVKIKACEMNNTQCLCNLLDLNQSQYPPMSLLPGTNSHIIHEPLLKFQKLNTCIGKAVIYTQQNTATAAVLFLTETHEWDSLPTEAGRVLSPCPRPLSWVKSLLESFVPSLYYTTELCVPKYKLAVWITRTALSQN